MDAVAEKIALDIAHQSMIANIILLALYLVRSAYGGLAALLADNTTFTHGEIQKRFFVEGSNFHRLMQNLSDLSDQAFGRSRGVRLIKINFLLLFFFLVALVWYSFRITGFGLLIGFFTRGLTVNLGDNERNYFLHNWPWHYVDLTRNAGKELYVGGQYLEGVILILILFFVLSTAFSLSILNTLSLVRLCGTERIRSLRNLLRMLGSVCFSILIDVSFLVVFLVTLLIGGRSINVSVEEVFKASTSQKWLEYAYEIVVGNARLGSTGIGVGIIIPDIDFEELDRSSDPAADWLHWIFPDPQFEYDAGPLCHRHELESMECADRLRSMYFKHFPPPDGLLEYLSEIVRRLYSLTGSIACGNDTWSPLVTESGAREGIALGFPWAAALAVTIISRFLIIPWLALILIIDHVLVRIGRYTALSSERGLTFLMRHGPTLLLTSPFIAITIIGVLARRFC